MNESEGPFEGLVSQNVVSSRSPPGRFTWQVLVEFAHDVHDVHAAIAPAVTAARRPKILESILLHRSKNVGCGKRERYCVRGAGTKVVLLLLLHYIYLWAADSLQEANVVAAQCE